MIHGPCEGNNDATCMKDYGPVVTCSKHFPRPHMEETVIDEHSYPSCRCRANAFSTTSKDPLNRRERITVGNEWVVPYNPYLSNVEVCGTIRAIGYIHKYTYKGFLRLIALLKNIALSRRHIGTLYVYRNPPAETPCANAYGTPYLLQLLTQQMAVGKVP
jgi:hypothetical protein